MCLDEMKSSLLDKHYQELALNQDKVKLNPNYAKYFELENRGNLYLATVRDDGKLIGYFIGFLENELHYQDCYACIMDILYLIPEYRGTKVGYHLLSFIEADLRSKGVQRWHMGCKLNKDLAKLYGMMDFKPVEMYHSKYIGD